MSPLFSSLVRILQRVDSRANVCYNTNTIKKRR
nr:MAG TPA: hypothetical protein [Caudoviricetes sp.]